MAYSQPDDLYFENGLPATLGHGINPEDTFEKWFEAEAIHMPISEFRDRFDAIQHTLDDMREDFKKGISEAAAETRRIDRTIWGSENYKGIMARIESLEGDRDRQRNRLNVVLGGFVALVVAIASGLIPAVAHGLVKLFS